MGAKWVVAAVCALCAPGCAQDEGTALSSEPTTPIVVGFRDEPELVATTQPVIRLPSVELDGVYVVPIFDEDFPAGLFEYNSDRITPEFGDALRGLVRSGEFISHGGPVFVIGFTDGSGPDPGNLQLSERRAIAVVTLLADEGVALELSPAGLGEVCAPTELQDETWRMVLVVFAAPDSSIDEYATCEFALRAIGDVGGSGNTGG